MNSEPLSSDVDTTFWPVKRRLPITVPWPTPGHPAWIHEFSEKEAWLNFLQGHDLHPAVPLPTRTLYRRAQKLYAYAWLEGDFIKAGELVAMAALEGGLKDCYGSAFAREPSLARLIEYMVEHDGLADETFPFSLRINASVVSILYEGQADRDERMKRSKEAKRVNGFVPLPPTTLASIRNELAHGDPFGGLPWSGLLEIVKDLIEYGYRGRIGEYEAPRGTAPEQSV